MILTKIKNNWQLFLLMGIQAGILFYDYGSIPFYHDELSAIERCKFSNLPDLLTKGIMVDGHPAGIQLFLFGLIKLFGIHEWVLKIPFLLAGMGSLYFLFRTSAFIFSKTAAITTGIFFIFLSYYIAQIILVRPYSPGLFFSLGTFYYALTLKKAPFKKYGYFMMALFSIGAMYSHYFSFLQVLCIWLVVFIFNHKKIYLKFYLVAIICSIAAFLPHIPITWFQLGMGGLGWLGKPDIYFFTNFFYTYFNSNIPLAIIAGVLFLLSFLVKKPRKKNKAVLLLLFTVPCIVLFVYSWLMAPVLQPVALYFCSPFLLIFIGCGTDFFKPLVRNIFILLLLLYHLYVLVILNNYYSLRDYQPIEKFVVSSQILAKEHPNTKTLYIWTGNSKYIQYFIEKHQFMQGIVSTDTLQDIRSLNVTAYDKVACSMLPPSLMFELSKTFPFIDTIDNNLLYNYMILSKDSTPRRLYSPAVKLVFSFDTGKEWSQASHTFKLDKLVSDRYKFIEFIPQLDSIMKGAELVLETYNGDERIDWRSIYLEPGNILSIKLKDVVKRIRPNHYLKLYIWNSTKNASAPITVNMYQRDDNPWEYVYKRPKHPLLGY